MGRAPCCDKENVKKGPWSPEEDAKLKEFMEKHGTGGNWIALPQKAGLRRCGKSCRLRWLNYLRPNIKHGEFSDDEDRLICTLFACIGSRWSIIAAQLPGRTDNDIKNYWNTKLKKKLINMIHPSQTKPHSHRPTYSSVLQTSSPPSPSPSLSSFLSSPNSTISAAILQPDQESFVGPIQNQVKESLLMFGGDQASCSSSDGSCNNQISHGKDYEYGDQLVLQNYLYNGVEENQKFMLSNGGSGVGGWTEKQNGMWGESTALDYGGLEEIKQLISSNSCNNFLFDENKTEERVMYY